jgi:hypothetical protein
LDKIDTVGEPARPLRREADRSKHRQTEHQETKPRPGLGNGFRP